MKVDKVPRRYFTVQDCIFQRTVHVLLNFNEKEFASWAHKKGATSYTENENQANFSAFSCDMTNKEGVTEWIVCLKEFDWTLRDQGSLIHEIVHTIVKIFHSNNIPFNHDTQEFIAHSVSNMYEDIAAKALRLKKRKTTKRESSK